MKISDVEKLSNEQLIQIIKKYKISESTSISRQIAIDLVKKYLQSKLNKDDDSDEDSDEDSDKEEITMDKRDIYVDMCPRDYNIKQIKLKQLVTKVNQSPGYSRHITFNSMRRIPDPDIPFPVDPDFFKN